MAAEYGQQQRQTLRHYQAFKFRFVAGIDEEGGVIRRAEVDAWLQELPAEDDAEDDGI